MSAASEHSEPQRRKVRIRSAHRAAGTAAEATAEGGRSRPKRTRTKPAEPSDSTRQTPAKSAPKGETAKAEERSAAVEADRRRRRGSSRRRDRRFERERAREERALAELGNVSEAELAPTDRDFLEDARKAGALVVPADGIRPQDIDRDAMKVISRLAQAGYEVYLVGGCVRDLLLDRSPKDFDVATEAYPQRIKRLFRNGRIIGRRFKLVHVTYGRNVIETSTFRASPEPPKSAPAGADGPVEIQGSEELLIVDDNRFGTAVEDARRRDFTINGLFLDPLEGMIFDYVGGLQDVEDRLLRTIGEPRLRMAEDPVRILRAVKFAKRLEFEIEEDTWEAMCALSPALERSAMPRVFEEILRLLLSGHARGAFDMLDQCGALGVILPELEEFLDSDTEEDREDIQWNLLGELDGRINRGDKPLVGEALAYLMLPCFEAELRSAERESKPSDPLALEVAEECLQSLSAATRVSRRDLGLAKRLLANQRRFDLRPSKSFRPSLFARRSEFQASLDLYRDHLLAKGESLEPVAEWEQRAAKAREIPAEDLPPPRRRRSRRR